MKNNSPNPYSTYGIKPPPSGGENHSRFELVSPYGPAATKEISDRQFSPKLLRALRSGWEELCETNREYFVGMTVHGSSVKGRIHDQSDLDISVFVNPDEFGSASDDQISRGYNFKAETFLNRRVEDISGHMINSGRIVFADFYPINAEILKSDTFDLVEATDQTTNPAEITSNRPELLQRLTELFGLRIGTGEVQEYRIMLLNELARMPKGEAAWKLLANIIVAREEHRRKANIYFPDTLKDVFKYYGFKIPEIASWLPVGDVSSKVALSGTRATVDEINSSESQDKQQNAEEDA